MARQKRTSPDLEAAKVRAAALGSVDKTMDFGKGVSLAAFNTKIKEGGDLLDLYNEKLSDLDDLLNQLQKAEADTNDLGARLLGGVKISYGPDSSEYEKAGGTRKSEQAKPGPKAKTKTNPPA
ncbi:MAG: hypothetical protein NTZ16_11955 [Verrucomicrobia bacterium]|nr:hypothetical protein [Verrucomicrobiota bacterium]